MKTGQYLFLHITEIKKIHHKFTYLKVSSKNCYIRIKGKRRKISPIFESTTFSNEFMIRSSIKEYL